MHPSLPLLRDFRDPQGVGPPACQKSMTLRRSYGKCGSALTPDMLDIKCVELTNLCRWVHLHESLHSYLVDSSQHCQIPQPRSKNEYLDRFHFNSLNGNDILIECTHLYPFKGVL